MSLSSSDTETKEIRRVKITFEANEIVAQKIDRAKKLLSKKYPKGQLEDIISEALDLLLEKKDPQNKSSKKTMISLPEKSSEEPKAYDKRRIPIHLKSQIWKRDHGKCSYQSSFGKRCNSEYFLEVDHIEPFALGGKNVIENLRLLCQTHNRYRSEQTFGGTFPREQS